MCNQHGEPNPKSSFFHTKTQVPHSGLLSHRGVGAQPSVDACTTPLQEGVTFEPKPWTLELGVGGSLGGRHFEIYSRVVRQGGGGGGRRAGTFEAYDGAMHDGYPLSVCAGTANTMCITAITRSCVRACVRVWTIEYHTAPGIA